MLVQHKRNPFLLGRGAVGARGSREIGLTFHKVYPLIIFTLLLLLRQQ
jgi:hypothetical protein